MGNVRREPHEGVDDELEVRHRDTQGIVDLVRDACGQRPGGRHALGNHELLAHLRALRTDDGLTQLALDGGRKTGEVVLQDVVVCPRLHGRNGEAFADGPGHQDERDVLARRLQVCERRHPAVAGYGIVRDDDVRRVHAKSRNELVPALHALDFGLVAAACELTQDQHLVIVRVFDEEQPEMGARRLPDAKAACTRRVLVPRRCTAGLTRPWSRGQPHGPLAMPQSQPSMKRDNRRLARAPRYVGFPRAFDDEGPCGRPMSPFIPHGQTKGAREARNRSSLRPWGLLAGDAHASRGDCALTSRRHTSDTAAPPRAPARRDRFSWWTTTNHSLVRCRGSCRGQATR